MSNPTYRDLLYFLKLLYTTVFAVTASLAPLHWGWFIDRICPTPCLQCCKLETVYTGCVTLLVMIGKYVCPLCQKQHKCLEYHVRQKYTEASVYCPHQLTVHCIMDYNGFYIVFCRFALRRSRPRAWKQCRRFCMGLNPREWKSSWEHLRCVSMHLTRE